MDIIQSCLALAPVPYLSTAFSIFRVIWDSVGQVQASNEQLQALSYSIAQLLEALDRGYRQDKLQPAGTSTQLEDLHKLLQEIARFVKKQSSANFVKLLFTKDDRTSRIVGYYQRIATLVQAFQISALLDITKWQSRHNTAQRMDQQALDAHLEANQKELIEQMNLQHSSLLGMMVSLQRKLDQQSTAGQERLFFSHGLTYLSTCSGRQIKVEDWMITTFEVDFMEEIGSGGFGQVFRGNWSKMEVALKVVKTDAEVTPSSESIRREIEVWSKLRHPHVLQFLGANILDDRPFLVMPYMKHGNARDYVQSHPESNRLQMLHDIALGLHYLHSRKIVHGDLKAMNVLIDDNIRAVLCDFGLSRMKADATSRTARLGGGNVTGSRNWMAPERIVGGSLKTPSDIYAFGMTIFEIYTNEIPLGHINYVDFIELVVRGDVRPEQPENSAELGLSDEIWLLAESCWTNKPLSRPIASALCDKVLHLIETTTVATPNVPRQPQVARPHLDQPYLTEPSPVAVPDVLHQPQVARPHVDQPYLTEPSPVAVPDVLHQPQVARPHVDQPHLTEPAPVAVPDVPHQPQVSRPQEGLPMLLQRSLIESRFLLGIPGPLVKRGSVAWSIVVSPDCKLVTSGSQDGIIRVWDAETGDSWELKGHTGAVCALSFSPDGKRIVSGSKDDTVRIWYAETGDSQKYPWRTESIESVAFAPDGKHIVSGSTHTIRIWDVATGAHRQLTGHTSPAYAVAYSLDEKSIASGSWDGTIRIWDSRTSHARSLSGHTTRVGCVAWSPDGLYIASGSEDSTICVWDVKTGTSRKITKHTETVISLAFSPNAKYIVSGSGDRTVCVWDVKSGALVSGPFTGHAGGIACVAFSRDGRHVVSVCYGGTVRAWNVDMLHPHDIRERSQLEPSWSWKDLLKKRTSAQR